MRVCAVFAIVAGVLLAAGCAESGSPTVSQRETSAAPSAVAPSAMTIPPLAATLAPSPVRPAPSAATGAPSAAPGSPPRVAVRRTGGFAGVEESLVVRPDGVWVWGAGAAGADQRGAPRSGRLAAAQRAELARLAASPALAREARQKPGPPQCADGFTYALTVGSMNVSWVDCDPVTPPTAVAITNLLAAATPL
jgi:hypothetical protein